MSGPGPKMKTMIQKRIYTVLPRLPPHAQPGPSSPPLAPISKRTHRPRSNSVSSSSSSRSLYTAPPSSGPLAFFDAPPPPPPSSRPGNPHVLSTSRLPVKGEGEGHSSHSQSQPTSNGTPHPHGQNSANTGGQPPFSLALTSPQANSSPPHAPAAYQSAALFPYSSLAPVPFYSVSASDHPDVHPRTKRHQPRYHLDVGAYGIPKRSNGKTIAGRDGFTSNPSSQSHRSSGTVFHDRSSEDLGLAVQVGEDAYFIRDNAMGVADGVGGWARARPDCAHSSNDPSPSALFARRLMHFCSAETSAAQQRASDAALLSRSAPEPSHMRPANVNAGFNIWPWASPVEQVQDELEDELEDLEDGLDVLMILERAYESTIKAHVVPSSAPSSGASSPSSLPADPGSPQPQLSAAQSVPPPATPLKTGSSTALVAVLQHSPRPKQEADTAPRFTLFQPTAQRDMPAPDAVLKIAHLGDCMGMLVRGEEVAWRSEEMWFGFNAPVQLGPSSNARPADAQIITLPVQQDDILILASDGLSDNLWDDEVLDEVVRFKRSFLSSSPPLSSASSSPLSSASASSSSSSSPSAIFDEPRAQGLLGRRTLAGMLSEALCSRARRVSERKGSSGSNTRTASPDEAEAEVPFARRAREQGKVFRGGKIDDISVLVAVISPAEDDAAGVL